MSQVASRPTGDVVDHLRRAFDTSALSLTVGAEEELMLVDPGSGALAAEADDVLGRLPRASGFQREFRSTQLEIATRPCLSAADVGRELAFARLELVEVTCEDRAVLACGTHPTATGLGPITNAERYRDVAADNPWAARHMLTCGLHIHVGLADADRALAVHNALRSYLPELASLSANSPYHESRRTGLASTRRMLTRSLARHGVPPAFPDWSAYADFSAWARAGASIPDPSYQWWDLRLHPGFGTLEMRVCDAQTDVADTVALVALVQTLVAWLAERHDAGETLPVHDDHRITESLWVASRDSATPDVLDLETGVRRPTSERLAELLAQLAPTARELGAEADLERLRALAVSRGADVQQQFVGEQGLDRLVGWLARRTSDSAREYSRQTDAAPDASSVEARVAGETRQSIPASA